MWSNRVDIYNAYNGIYFSNVHIKGEKDEISR